MSCADVFVPFPTLEGRVRVMIACRDDDIVDASDLAARLGASSYASMIQVHGNVVKDVSGDSHDLLECDALVTNTPGVALIVKWADCQNFVIYDPEHRALAGVHAGWRGMAAKMLTETFAHMRATYGTDATQAYVYAGPSLCVKHAEFTDPHAELPAHLHPFIAHRHVDLIAAADQELFSLGVAPERFFRDSATTCCDPEAYWTVRGGNCGPNAIVVPTQNIRQRNLIGACLC